MAGPLTAIWEAKLKAEGLRALDDGDPGSTYAVDANPGFHNRSEQHGTKYLRPGVTTALRAEFWRRAEGAAERLPYGYPRGPFIRRVVELGNVHRARLEMGLSHRRAWWAWRRFLVFAGLPAPLTKGSQGRKRPTKPGQVRIEAGRYREERAA